MLVSNFLICFRYCLTWMWFVITLICTLMDELYLWTLCNMWYVCWIMYDLGCMLVESRPFAVLDGLPDLYGLKYDSTSTCGLPLYLCSYKLVGSATKTSHKMMKQIQSDLHWRMAKILFWETRVKKMALLYRVTAKPVKIQLQKEVNILASTN